LEVIVTMQILLLLAALIALAAIVVTIAGLRNAPEGFEDRNGFHAIEESEVLATMHAARRDAEEHEDAPGATPHAA
jgi:hypothetical protein